VAGTALTARRQDAERVRRTLLARTLLLAGALAAAFLFHHEILGYALVGHDTYPILVAARVRNAGDLAGTFTEELMDGRYDQGRFYRPVLNASFAIDHAFYGLRPWGYHLTDLLLAACAALLLAHLARPGRRAAWGIAGVAAGVLFLAHPAQMNVLPVPARRGETLSIGFTALALLAARGTGRARRWGPALFALLAAGSKESGAIAPLLLFGQALFGPRSEGRGRIRGALREAALPFLALAVFLAARALVLGGVGGHGGAGARATLFQALRTVLMINRYTFYPYDLFARAIPPGLAALALLAGFAGASFFLFRGSESRGSGLAAWGWFLAGSAVHVLARSSAPWYALHAVAAHAVLSGLLLGEAARRCAAAGPARARFGSALIAAAILALGAVNARNAPPFGFHPEWKDATRKTERFLDRLAGDLAAAPPGSTVEAADLPYLSRPRPGSPIAIVASLADYSVQAWAELRFPGRRVRVAFPDPPPPPPNPGETLVVVTPGR
jgi:hypothetical protein